MRTIYELTQNGPNSAINTVERERERERERVNNEINLTIILMVI